MRIAEIAPPWLAVPPRGYGGIEWVVSLLADGLAERGHDVTLFATGDSTTAARLDFSIERAPGPASINDPHLDTLHTLHAFREPEAFDVFHVHAPWSALAVAAALERPTVHTVHGSFTLEMRRLYEAIGDRVWFVAISQAQRAHMPELHYGGVVYNGVDLARYPFRSDKEDFVLFLGRAAPEKGARLAALAAREAGVRLVLATKVADRREEDYWRDRVLPVLPPDAVMVGEVGHDQKVDLLGRARCVLFPIDWDEPFGLVMAEAMACGTPVIGTPRGSAPEVVAEGETGFIVPVEDYPSAAARALRSVGDLDPRACRARAEQRFSKERMVEGYEEVFARAVSAEGAGGASAKGAD